MNHLIIQYSYLQMLDLMTTLAFLLHGVQEGNPLMRLALRTAPSPVSGLLMMKMMAIGLGIYCWRRGRYKLLGRINALFAVVIVWNLVALILGSAKV